MTTLYYYAWKNNAKRAILYRRRCNVVARLAMNSAVVEFENGQRECVSRNALRKLKGEYECAPRECGWLVIGK